MFSAAALLCSALLLAAAAAAMADVGLPAAEQEAAYRVLEAVNPGVEWRSLFPEDLCLSGPHGVVCDLFPGDVDVVHVVELNLGYVSDYSPNPSCGDSPALSPHLSAASFPFLRKLFFYRCFTRANATPSAALTDAFWAQLPSASLEELVFVENPALGGRLSPRLGGFARLARLVVSGSAVAGAVPAELGQLTELRELTLSRSRLGGEVPGALGRCGGLKVLDLSGNRLEGPLPEGLGRLDGLLKMDLSKNRISGAVPGELAGLRRLQLLDLSDNALTGGVPAEVAGMTELRELHLSGNPLGEEIPAGIWQGLTGLLGLRISGAGLVGRIPPAMGVFLGNLSFLALDNNGLEGALPEELRRVEATAREINLENNRLSGRVPFSAHFVATIGRKLKLAGNPALCLDGELAETGRRRRGPVAVLAASLAACPAAELPHPTLPPLPTGGARSGGPPSFSFFITLIIITSIFLFELLLQPVIPPFAAFI
ncbi:ROP-interactive CRIB motif-containing protein 7 [Wolffia australiana]